MLFSVIIPVYNVERYLNKCVDSLLKQEYSDMEIIIVDDKSTDQSLCIAKKYQSHPNVEVIAKEKNSGLSETRNVGVKAAKGEYVLFLDSDDYVESGCMIQIEQIIKNAKRPSVIYFGYYEEYEGRNDVNKKFGFVSAKNQLYTGEDFAIGELKRRNLYAPACFGIYKRELIVNNKIYFKNGILHEDELWTPQVVLNADTIYTSECVYYHYLRRKGSITKTEDKTKHGMDMLFICDELDKISSDIKNCELKKYMDNHIAMLYMKGMTEGRLYNKQNVIDRFYPLRKVCFAKDFAKAILFAFNLKLYYKINMVSIQG